MRRSDVAHPRSTRLRCLHGTPLSAVVVAAALTTAALPAALGAQGAGHAGHGGHDGHPRSLTANDYARAEAFLGQNATQLTTGPAGGPTWIDEGPEFWYRSDVIGGSRFMLVEPMAGARRPAFDHVRLAAALSEAADTAYEPLKLPFRTFEYEDGRSAITFEVSDSVGWRCDLGAYACARRNPDDGVADDERESPDGRWAAFVRDENLWVRNLETGQETQLSTDGEEDFGYAVNPEGCCGQVTRTRRNLKVPPFVVWSEDSRKILTHKLDERGVRTMTLLEVSEDGPIGHDYLNALPGDSVIPHFEIHVFEVETGRQVEVDVEPLVYTNTSCCGIQVEKDVRWGPDGDVWFTRGRRSFDTLDLMTADAETGEARLVHTETHPTYVEIAQQSGGNNWRVVDDGERVVWWSERSGYGHLYLLDAATGRVQHPITSGDWLVASVEHVDEAGRWVYFTGLGREEGVDIYHRQFYRARLDGSRIERLTSDAADHQIAAAPEGQVFVDQTGRPDAVPVVSVRGPNGQPMMSVEEGDYSRLLEAGWRWPTHFEVMARDGSTPVHGFLYFPSDYDPEKSYPVVDYIYPGPQTGPIGSRQPSATGGGGNPHALAELGFIVFKIDAMGTPNRSKAFHDAYYGDMGDNGIPDHIAAMKQLARTHPAMDLSRVGIFGHSGGGFSSTGAILRYPDFYKVAVSSAGNHDNRSYDYTWGEKYQGLLVEDTARGGDSFDSQANHLLAENLEGKLYLMYGTLDDNVHPNATLLVIQELIKAGKDFDLLVYPNGNHGFLDDYTTRRTWDYFVKHLMGAEPPDEYTIRQGG